MSTFQSLPIRQATWLELFVDLVFVAVIGVIGHTLGHTHHGHLSADQLFNFFLTFLPVLWVWATHTMYSNRYDLDDNKQKYLTLGLMGLVIVMSRFIDDSAEEGFTGFVLCYIAMRAVLAYAYFTAPKSTPEGDVLAQKAGRAVSIGGAISLLSIFMPHGLREMFFYGGIAVEIILQLMMGSDAQAFPVHRKHLAERIGLLAIIVLGETVISIVGSLSSAVEISGFGIVSAVAGFVLIAQIWWVFYGSLHRLELAKSIKTGNVMILSHLIFYVGLIFLANLVRHAIQQDLDQPTFAIMAIVGMTLFYLGKQIPYIVAMPPYRNGIIFNSVVCIAITAVAALLPRIEFSLIAMCIGMIVYVQLNVRWLIPKFDVSEYLDEEEHV